MAISLDKFGPEQKKLISIILVGMIVLYIDYASIIKMQLGSIKSASVKVVKIQKDLAALNKDLVSMQKNQQDTKKITLKSKKIISEGEITALLQEIFSIANNKDKIRINQIKPVRDPKAKEEAMGSIKVIPVAIAMDLTCVYHDFGSFINDLENAEPFLALQEMRISPINEDYMRQLVTLKLKTYVKK